MSTAQGSPAPVAIGVNPATQRVSFDGGLVLEAPAGWYVSKAGPVNRGTERLTMVSSAPPTALPTIPGNGDVDAAGLLPGTVSVEVESFCRLSCQGPITEGSLPLDWKAASPLRTASLPAGRKEMAVAFRWFDRPIYVVARWSFDTAAPLGTLREQADTIARIVESVHADPAPLSSGNYFGWINAGPLDAIAVGDVRSVPLPANAPHVGRIQDDTPFFVVRGKVNTYAFVSRPLVDERCEIDYDAASDHFRCVANGRTYEWSRFGHFLGPEPASDLPRHRVIVRDGTVWVRHDRDSLVPVQDEAAER